MKQSWEIKKLGEVCEINPSKKEANTKLGLDDKVSFLPMEDLGIKAYYITPSQERSLSEVLSSYTYFADGDVLLAKVSPCFENGKIGIANNLTNGVGFGSSEYLTFRLGKDVIKEFLYFYLQNKTFVKEATKNLTGTSGLRRVPKSFIESCRIPIPPREQQERIVAELDCLSGVIEKKREQLKELDTLAQSIFYQMFGDPISNEKGWKISTIENICSSIVRGPFGSALKKEYFVEQSNTTYKVYEQKHAIQKDPSIGTYYISADMFETLSRFEIKEGDIIMSCSGTIGEFYEIPIGAEKGIMNQALLKYTLNKNIHKIYFLYVMEWVKENFEKKGSGLQNIGSVKTIKSTDISLPPLTLQQEFADKIEAIEKQKELIKQSIKETETLFNARMDYYFN